MLCLSPVMLEHPGRSGNIRQIEAQRREAKCLREGHLDNISELVSFELSAEALHLKDKDKR